MATDSSDTVERNARQARETRKTPTDGQYWPKVNQAIEYFVGGAREAYQKFGDIFLWPLPSPLTMPRHQRAGQEHFFSEILERLKGSRELGRFHSAAERSVLEDSRNSIQPTLQQLGDIDTASLAAELPAEASQVAQDALNNFTNAFKTAAKNHHTDDMFGSPAERLSTLTKQATEKLSSALDGSNLDAAKAEARSTIDHLAEQKKALLRRKTAEMFCITEDPSSVTDDPSSSPVDLEKFKNSPEYNLIKKRINDAATQQDETEEAKELRIIEETFQEICQYVDDQIDQQAQRAKGRLDGTLDTNTCQRIFSDQAKTTTMPDARGDQKLDKLYTNLLGAHAFALNHDLVESNTESEQTDALATIQRQLIADVEQLFADTRNDTDHVHTLEQTQLELQQILVNAKEKCDTYAANKQACLDKAATETYGTDDQGKMTLEAFDTFKRSTNYTSLCEAGLVKETDSPEAQMEAINTLCQQQLEANKKQVSEERAETHRRLSELSEQAYTSMFVVARDLVALRAKFGSEAEMLKFIEDNNCYLTNPDTDVQLGGVPDYQKALVVREEQLNKQTGWSGHLSSVSVDGVTGSTSVNIHSGASPIEMEAVIDRQLSMHLSKRRQLDAAKGIKTKIPARITMIAKGDPGPHQDRNTINVAASQALRLLDRDDFDVRPEEEYQAADYQRSNDPIQFKLGLQKGEIRATMADWCPDPPGKLFLSLSTQEDHQYNMQRPANTPPHLIGKQREIAQAWKAKQQRLEQRKTFENPERLTDLRQQAMRKMGEDARQAQAADAADNSNTTTMNPLQVGPST